MNTEDEYVHWTPVGVGQHEGLEAELLVIESKSASGAWLAYGLYRSGGQVAWLGDPVPSHVGVDPEDAFDYWQEKDSNGYSYAVFGYWVRSKDAAEDLLELRADQLANGASPLPPIEVGLVGLASPTNHPSSVLAAPDEAPGEAEPEEVALNEDTEALALPHATALALVWRLGAELVRRYPQRLWVQAESGGMYDRTTVFDLASGHPQVVAIFNARGSAQMTPTGRVQNWTDAYEADADRSEWLTVTAREANLPPRGHGLPPSTPASLVARWVAAFLALQIGARHDWFAGPPGHFPDGVRSMPALDAWQRENGELGTDVVCLAERGATGPRLALTISGDLWRDDGQHFRLTEVHQPGQPATAMVVQTVPDLLP